MREWTDVDYAQAAIDMLPEEVEEIVEFLRAQGVESHWVYNQCPIDLWVTKWVDNSAATGTSVVYTKHGRVFLPSKVRRYIDYVDGV